MIVVEIIPGVTIRISNGAAVSSDPMAQRLADNVMKLEPNGPQIPNYDRYLADKIIEIARLGKVVSDDSVAESEEDVVY